MAKSRRRVSSQDDLFWDIVDMAWQGFKQAWADHYRVQAQAKKEPKSIKANYTVIVPAELENNAP